MMKSRCTSKSSKLAAVMMLGLSISDVKFGFLIIFFYFNFSFFHTLVLEFITNLDVKSCLSREAVG